MKKFISVSAVIFLLSTWFASHSYAQPRLENTFNSCSIYLPSGSGTSSEVSYRKAGESTWKATFPLYHDMKRKEFRGSIVLLNEDTEYEVRTIIRTGNEVTEEKISGFKTWTATPTIGREVLLSSFLKSGKYVDVQNLKGSATSWIRIIPDIAINAGTSSDYALRFVNCSYVLLEGASIRGGRINAVDLLSTASDIRLINCNISKWGRLAVSQNANGHYLDKDGVAVNYDSGVKIGKAKNIVIERCYIHSPNGKTNPWKGVVELGPHAGTAFKSSHPMGPNGIFVLQNGGNLVIRYNDIIGDQLHRFNDGIEGQKNGFVEGGFYNDADVYGNMIAFGQDDGIELDGGQCNVRLYGNRFEQSYSGISLAPNKKGPSYVFYNVVTNPGASDGSSSAAVKNGGGVTNTEGTQFLFNNTMIFNGNGMRGVGYGPSSAADKREMFLAYTRNNIFLATQAPSGSGKDARGYSISDIHELPENNFDYDLLGNKQNEGGKGKIQANKDAEKNGVFASPNFINFDKGIYTLQASDPGVARGIAVPNFMENFVGHAPNMGAFQTGAATLYPQRPLDISSDHYHLNISVGSTRTIKLTVGNVAESDFEILKAEDMSWLEVTASDTKIRPNTTLSLTVKANPAQHRKVGGLLVRLKNGLSVPITVFAN